MGIRYLDEAPVSSGSSSIKYLEPEEDQYRKAARESATVSSPRVAQACWTKATRGA